MKIMRSGPYIAVSFATVTVLAVLSAVLPAHMLTFGMLALGPALAAASANPPAVLAVGGYALAAAGAVSTRHGLLGSVDQVVRLLVVLAATGIGWGIARHLRRLLDGAADAAKHQEMLAAIIEQSSDAIIVTDLDGTITTWNRGAENLYGYPAAEVIGTKFSKVLPPGRLEALTEKLAELASGRPVQLDETRRVCRDGSEVLVSVAVAPIRDQQGRVVAAAATERDITQKERSARAARMESLGQLAGGVAHDFNNLLAIIGNYAEMLADQVTPQGAADLERIRNAAGQAGSLTSQLLLFAKRDPTQVEEVDLNESVAGAYDLLSRSIGAGVELTCRLHPGTVPVCANRGRLDQILLNLVINARDAMPGGGMVVIETDLIEVPAGMAAPVPPGRYGKLTVSDTGTGMTPEVRDRLFEPFFTTKPIDQGTGLGLSTVYGIVTDARGHITVDSTPGIGTTFVILLPVTDVPARLPA
ncbi:PAS domain S-box protein [Actinoplanes sp. NPDC023714]|uniref:two-component system sensor histidine kinase NtrB n=1 Tax=Actinoplanes sp. NPDC023714 TaxID=3154322 RepID=UPI0033F218A2